MGIGMVKDSKWLTETNKQQIISYPNYPDNFKDMKHFYMRGHDCSVEVLAEGFNWKEIGCFTF